MQENTNAQIDQELRRHLAGIQQGIIDAAHIWCSAETHIRTNSGGFTTETGEQSWSRLPGELIDVLALLQQCIQTSGEPISLTWWEFGQRLASDMETLKTRFDMLQSDL